MLNHCHRAKPFDHLRKIGVQLFVVSVGAIDLWADGVQSVSLLGIGVIGIIVVLCLFLPGIVKYIHARLGVAVRVLPISTPDDVQVLLRLLPRAIWVISIPLCLLSITGDTSGLLGLFCGIQLLLIGTCVGLLGWALAHAWTFEGAAGQQERPPSIQAPLYDNARETPMHVLYAQSPLTMQEAQMGDRSIPPEQYADYGTQAQYPPLQ